MLYEWWPPQPWPVAKDLSVFSLPVEGGHLSVVATVNGNLRISIREDDAASVDVDTCPIEINALRLFKIAAEWKGKFITIFADGEIIGSNEPDKTVINKLTIEPKAIAPGDPSEASGAHYCKLRAEKVRTLQAKPGRRLLTPQEMMDDLEKEYHQICDLLGLIRKGARYHVIGLAGRVRTIIARGHTLDPLLQRVAGITYSPLPVYTSRGANKQEEPEPSWDVQFNIFPAPMVGIDLELDLDEWLQQTGCSSKGRRWSNNEVIRAIADTDGPSHYDPSIEPIIDFFNGLLMVERERDNLQSLMERVVVSVAETILALIEQIRKDFAAQENGKL